MKTIGKDEDLQTFTNQEILELSPSSRSKMTLKANPIIRSSLDQYAPTQTQS